MIIFLYVPLKNILFIRRHLFLSIKVVLRFNNSKEVYIWNNGFWYILYQWHDELDEDFNIDFYFDNVYQNFTLTIFMRILPWQFEFLGNRHLGCCDHWMQIGESSSNQYTALWCSCQPDLAKPAIHTCQNQALSHFLIQGSLSPIINTGNTSPVKCCRFMVIILHGKDFCTTKKSGPFLLKKHKFFKIDLLFFQI